MHKILTAARIEFLEFLNGFDGLDEFIPLEQSLQRLRVPCFEHLVRQSFGPFETGRFDDGRRFFGRRRLFCRPADGFDSVRSAVGRLEFVDGRFGAYDVIPVRLYADLTLRPLAPRAQRDVRSPEDSSLLFDNRRPETPLKCLST